MEQYQHLIHAITLTLGVSWASGINLYATLLMLGFLGSTGYLELPPGLQILTDPLVIGAAAVMYFVEFFADKVPGVDTGWDALHTFVRIPAGAALAAGAIGEMAAPIELAAAIVGGTIAASTHATKAGSRVLINTSPEPFSNWFASLGEDLLAIAGLWTALNHPILFLVVFILFILLLIWLLPRLWRAIKRVLVLVGRFFGVTKDGSKTTSGSGPPRDSSG